MKLKPERYSTDRAQVYNAHMNMLARTICTREHINMRVVQGVFLRPDKFKSLKKREDFIKSKPNFEMMMV